MFENGCCYNLEETKDKVAVNMLSTCFVMFVWVLFELDKYQLSNESIVSDIYTIELHPCFLDTDIYYILMYTLQEARVDK